MEGNYNLDGIEDRAKLARVAHCDYISGLLREYDNRCVSRKEKGIIPIGVCGHGRAGKDTAAEFICGHTEAVYPRSASWLVLPLVAHMAGIPPEVAWQERHQHRECWIESCHAIRGKDYTMLIRMCLGAGDIAVGIRGRLELDAAVHQGIVGMTLWIDNPRVPADPTVEYGPDDCDIMVCNGGSRLAFYAKLRKLLSLMGK